MKKSIIALLVLVSAVVCQAASVEEIYEYYNGVFTITQDGDLMLTYFSKDSKYGHIDEFGYYKVDDPDKKYMVDDKLHGNETVTIKNLKAGDKIGLYIKSDKSENLTIYSTDVTLPDTTTIFSETENGFTFGDTKWDARVLGFTATSTPSAPSGQPLPGALTTMLIAGGCAAYLKRKKSARK